MENSFFLCADLRWDMGGPPEEQRPLCLLLYLGSVVRVRGGGGWALPLEASTGHRRLNQASFAIKN